MGVANDRQQAIEGQSHDRGRATDAKQGYQKDKERERRDSLDNPRDPKHDLAYALTARRQDAQRNGDNDRSCERNTNQQQMFPSMAPESCHAVRA